MATECDIVGPGAPFSSIGQRRHALEMLATAQHGVVARRQLLGLGFSVDEVRGMLDRRRLVTIHRGVYAAGHRALSERARWMAAVLAGGPWALLSHRSSAALASLRGSYLGYAEVSTPTRRRGIAGVRSYFVPRLQPQDRTTIDGIPCTSVALTLLQLAAVVPRRQLERACDEAEVQRVFDLAAVEDVLRRFAGCRGAAQLRAVLDEHAIGTTLTRPGLEELALTVCDRAGIARPHVNVLLTCRPGIAWEVDFLWRAERVVLETDGGRFHRTRRRIERDRRKEADLVRAGYRVLRATYRQVAHDARSIELMLRAALDGR